MRVLFVIDSLGAGGAEKSTAILLPRLRALGVECLVAVLRTEPEGFEDEVRAAGFRIEPLAGSTPAKILRLRRLIRSWQPDVVHTVVYMADQVGRVAALGTRTRVVSSWVSVPRIKRFRSPSDPPAWKIAVVNAIDLVTGRIAVDRYHAVTAGVADLYRRAYHVRPSRVAVVERGRDPAALGTRTPERRAEVRLRLGAKPDQPVIVAVGRQDLAKGHTDLIRAMELMRREHSDAILWIAGRPGNASLAIQETIDAIDDAKSFTRLLGHRTDVADLITAADVMALSSQFEGAAGAVLEAMALGTPVVATRLEGMAGILEHERNALIVDIGRPGQMAAAMARLLDDPVLSQSLARCAQRDFERRFSLEATASDMYRLYNEVLQHSH